MDEKSSKKPQHPNIGGKRPGAGRPKGVPNRATERQKGNLEQLARTYTEEALETLASIMRTGESEAARVSAVGQILDRAYGKARQSIEHGGQDGDPNIRIAADDAFRDLIIALDGAARAAAGGHSGAFPMDCQGSA